MPRSAAQAICDRCSAASSLDELLSQSGPGGTVSYTYDSNCNQTGAGSETFAYDLANRLSSTTSGGTTITYTSDGDGERPQAASGTQASTKTKYLWDVNGALPTLVREGTGRKSYSAGTSTGSILAFGAWPT